MMQSLVEIDRLTKRYGDIPALLDCSFEVRSGEVLGLLGPNGSGKTTLIRLLMGYLAPTSGRATIEGMDCYHQSVAVHRRVTYLPGEVRLFGGMAGREVLQFFASLHPAGNYDRSLQLADRLSLDLSRPVAYCSTGMRQKLALVATMAAETPFVILDEPTANLDPTVRGEVLAILREARAAGRTVLFSSHVLSETEQACDRVCILRKGRLAHVQTVAELKRQHRIRATLNGELSPPPSALAADLRIDVDRRGRLTILTAAELSLLFGWLASLPLREVQIEPISLQVVYDRFHAPEDEATE